jgi:hypothetical protein
VLPLAIMVALAHGQEEGTLARGRSQPEARVNRPAFHDPRPVAVDGYDDHVMEPFLTRDGKFLLFNNSNDPPEKTDLHLARRVSDRSFRYVGKLSGANSPALDGVPSVDREGRLYFVSTRSYDATLSTIFQGRFAEGKVTGVEIAPGISRRRRGQVNFDAEISADGTYLYFVDGFFTGGPVPTSADLTIAKRNGASFERLPRAGELLARVNTTALEYAPATSADGLELFFTRLEPDKSPPRIGIFRATRSGIDAPFGEPERIEAIRGFVEAPSLSPDERTLYYHKRSGERFVLECVSR